MVLDCQFRSLLKYMYDDPVFTVFNAHSVGFRIIATVLQSKVCKLVVKTRAYVGMCFLF